MIKILTDNKQEYDLITKIMDEEKDSLKNIFIDICKPEDSIACVTWSIDDVKKYFPKETPDYIIEEGLANIEKILKENMISNGWQTIKELKDSMLEVLKSEE